METNHHLAQILSRLNEWLSAQNLYLTPKNVLFVRDDAVNYRRNPCRVDQADLVSAERFDEVFASMQAGGPSWIHANVIPLDNQQFLITICAGQKIGNPKPSINVSYETKSAEILSAKILVTAH